MKAFQDLTAKKMSRFVTLRALTRLQRRTPKSAPRRLCYDTSGNTPPPLDGGGRLEYLRSQDVRLLDISGQRSQDEPHRHRGCQAGQHLCYFTSGASL